MRAAAVATLPALRVEIAGAAIETADGRALATVRVSQRLSQPSQCELQFLEPGGAIGLGMPNVVGLSLRLALEDGAATLFAGEVTAIEHVHSAERGHVVLVRGYDRLHRLRRRQPLRAHEPMDLEALVSSVVADLGVAVRFHASGPPLPRVLQCGASDLELLAQECARHGRYFALRGDELHLLDLRGVDDPLALRLGAELLEARCEINGDPACAAVTAHGWDPSRFAMHSETAAEANSARTAFAEVPSDFLDADGRHQAHQLAAGADQARARAQAELDLRSAAAVTLQGVALGSAELRPGARVEVEGIAEPFAGTHVVAAATHRIDGDHGYVTEFDTRPPAPPPPREGATMLPGRVSSVDDPEKLGRVKVTLPACADVETDWLGVLGLAAGAGKGLVALPDVGDQVVVLAPCGDPAAGVVLGGLFGGDPPPDAGVESGRTRRFSFRTPGGHKLELDDAGRRLRLEDGAGSFLEMKPDHVALRSTADLTIDAPGRAIVVAANTIDFKRA